MVIAPANTGNDSNNRKAVTNIDQTNSGILCKVIPGARILNIVVIKLIAPSMDDAPAICKEKIARSTAGPGAPSDEDNGGYSVQPPPTPSPPAVPSTNSEANSRIKDAGKSQKDILFIRGKAISGAPIIRGTIQFPKPPIIAGMTIKKIIIKP
jgi:hypothetical protein